MNILVDTSIVIDHLRGGKKWESIKTSLGEDDWLYMPTIVIYELFSGDSTKKLEKLKEVTDFIQHFRKIELTESIAESAGKLCREYKKTIQVQDYIIAASAISVNAQIVTLNQKHFQKISGVSLYEVE
jgi:tRNA(fMet)-specific endonuclease VapC